MYRTVGLLLFLLNAALSGMIIQVIWHGKSYSYPGFFIFAMAFYAFYRITIAVIRLFKGRKDRIEGGVVGAYTKIEDKFVDQFLTKDGETVEEAKARLKKEQQEREKAKQ